MGRVSYGDVRGTATLSASSPSSPGGRCPIDVDCARTPGLTPDSVWRVFTEEFPHHLETLRPMREYRPGARE